MRTGRSGSLRDQPKELTESRKVVEAMIPVQTPADLIKRGGVQHVFWVLLQTDWCVLARVTHEKKGVNHRRRLQGLCTTETRECVQMICRWWWWQ